MSEKRHSMLSPSSSERWLNCPPSAWLSQMTERVESDAMKEGTLAHEIAALILSGEATAEDMRELKENPYFSKEMMVHAMEYKRFVETLKDRHEQYAITSVEYEVDLSFLEPDGVGTADCVIVSPDRLTVVDYKYGVGKKIEATENSQMMLYALGVYDALGESLPFKEVTLAIFQPRNGGGGVWDTTVDDLEIFRWERVVPAARQALNYKGPVIPGDWCGFCPGKAYCRKYLDRFREPTEDFWKLSDDEVGEYLSRLEGVEACVKQLKERAKALMLEGHEVDGYKLVNGPSKRDWGSTPPKDFREAGRQAGLEEDELYETKPLSPAQIEKKVGKAGFAAYFSELVHTKKGNPIVARENDRRRKYTPED